MPHCSRLQCALVIGSIAAAIPAALSAQSLGTLKGHVAGPSGEALAGATVSVTGLARGAIARNDGAYQVLIPAGRYEIRTRLLGYASRIDSVTITAGAVTTLDLQVARVTTNLESVAILASRGEERTVISAPVPIDVLSAADLLQSGRTETAQMIQSIAPSFNLPRTTVGDGTDHIRPATLRGLAPDQALILINGKRRHTSSLVNVNGFVGRGSQAVDLNAIPASMIDHIEILRDGAAAQYGSDAIAGVINVVLKSNAPATLTMEAGENVTTYNRDANASVAFPAQLDERSVHDGGVLTTALNASWSNGPSSFVSIGGEVRNRSGTNRTLPDTRRQYFGGDPRNDNPPVINHWQGDSYNHDGQIFVNGEQTLGRGVTAYGFGGLGHRRGASAGFWRRPNDDRTLRSIYPDGFLPFIKSDIGDASVSLGLRGDALGWKWDLGTVYGRNRFAFTIDNTANVSLGNASPTSFDAGALRASQSTTTFDLFRELRSLWRAPLRVALGAEYRRDGYGITAGDSSSFRDGRVTVFDSVGNPTQRVAPVGSQVFPGFRPSDAGSHARRNVAGYIDLESDVTSRLLLGVAGRYEHYSDFGATSTGKLAARYALHPRLALRGALSTGFRAPSLGQEFFSSTATNFVNGQAFDVRTFPVNTREAQLLGAAPLEPERSFNLSGGLAFEAGRGFGFTADYYDITITNRIVLTDNFTGAAVQALFDQAGLRGVSGGRFFTNAIDTRSHGVDLVANYGVSLGTGSLLRLTSGYNHNTVSVTHVDATPANLSAFQESLFGRPERGRIELGNPRDNFFLSTSYDRGWLGLTARTQRYGAVTTLGASASNATGPLDQTYGAKWITDLSGTFSLRSRYRVTIGADNLFDVYPDRNINPGDPATANGGLSNFGIFPYSGISPFGFNGRFVYTRLALSL